MKVANPTDRPALFVRLALADRPGGSEILPVFWDDNYFSLLPGESREIAAGLPTDAPGEPVLEVGGWNVEAPYLCFQSPEHWILFHTIAPLLERRAMDWTSTVKGSKMPGLNECGEGMRLHDRFEWDEGKAQANARKHGVTFDLAAEVLLDEEGDRCHFEEYDESLAGGEDRFITTASHPALRDLVLVIAWTERDSEFGPVTRIISARRATRVEKDRYESEIRGSADR